MNEIQSILKELLAADPSLKDREKELLPLLKLLVENKPKAEPTEDFKRRLHAEIRIKQSDLSAVALAKAESPFTSFFSFLMNKQYSVALAGLLLGVIITGPVVYYGLPSGSKPASGSPLFSYSVSDTGANAFGDFAGTTEMSRSQSGGGGPVGMAGGGGGGNPAPMVAADSAGAGADAKMVAPDSMIYRPQVYTYKIDGEIPALTDAQVQVLRRNKVVTDSDAKAILNSFNLGSIDLGSFGSLKTDSVSLYQDGKNGYMMYISFREGSVSINQNWETWDHPESKCTTEACYQQYRIKESDIPADDVLIGVANGFVKDHGIDLSQYGEPEVDNSWRVSLAAMSAADRAMYWFPESARVIYPQLVDGKPVYEQGGQKAGISVGVNVRQKKVSDVYGILSQNYTRSSYEAVTTSGAIIDFLARSGNMYGGGMPPNTIPEKIEITLGAPTLAFTKVYNYENGRSDELVVPALVFPVKNVPEGTYYYNQSVTVPLAKELMDKMMLQYPVMPMMDAVR